MARNPENLEEIKAKHQDLCRELNMDKETEEASWDNYKEISQNFTLDDDPAHWLCCSLYAACRESYTPTVGSSNSVVKGNCVSLTKLLRNCNISIYEFFTKIKNWIEMANLSRNFLNQVDRLERGFSITYHIYKQYHDIFERLFIVGGNEKKIKRARPGKCSASKLYDLCWCLFLCAKNEDPKNTVDVYTIFHLLLCCIDLIFSNAVAENRTDLVNPSFKGVPKKWNTSEFDAKSVSPICIMDSLCQIYSAPYTEAKSMKMNSWNAIMGKLIKSKTLHGDAGNFLGIISNVTFEPNLKSLNNAYEHYVLSVGEFDERIFVSNPNYRKSNNNDFDKDKHQSHMNSSVRSLVPSTPLTRKHHLPTKDVSEPVACATQNVKKLQEIADSLTEMPEFVKQTGETTVQKIEDRLTSMCETFCDKFPTKPEAQKRFQLARSLYFYLLEKIIKVEKKTKPNLDLKVLLETETFNSTVIACCIEIVFAAYNSHLNFPWILECFSMPAYNFYKIIEIVVSRHENVLSREQIKHLNRIEETCLESLVWRSNSPLWDAMKEVSLPSWASVDIKKMEFENLQRNLIQSPINSAYDCFNQPATSTTETARRDLFNAGKATETTDRSLVEAPKNTQPQPDGRKRAGSSLPLFFRKFYKLAFLRIKELCKELEMEEEMYLNKIWTLFEYSIVNSIELMQDRHLDQLIMCAIYVFIKVGEIQGKTFTDIMKFYRNQPQAASNIYREVLIEPGKTDADGNDVKPKYGDIINFYNQVYVQKMTPYALKFGDKKKSQHDLLLSPHPPSKNQYPKKVSNFHHLYIQPLDKKMNLPQSPNNFVYEISSSPAKDLNKINEIVRNGKRNLPFDDDDLNTIVTKKLTKPSQDSYFQRKLHGIIKDRQVEERKE